MSKGRFSFPSPAPEALRFEGFLSTPRFTVLCQDPAHHVDHEDYVRERTAQSKYPAAMLAELYAAGEINKEQYERLRRERA